MSSASEFPVRLYDTEGVVLSDTAAAPAKRRS